jgi:toxin ParE1/3/4
MSSFRFSPKARIDVLEIWEYIASDNLQAADDWFRRIERKCELLSCTPELGERRPEFGTGIRSSVLGRYILY